MDTPLLISIAFAGILTISIFIYLAIRYFINYNCNNLHQDCMKCPMNWLCRDPLDPSWRKTENEDTGSITAHR